MDPISRLTEYFREFPGIGPRQAKRFVYFLLTRNASYLDEISKLILDIKNNIKICKSCFRFYQDQNNNNKCAICNDKNRDSRQLMLVSRDVDLEAVEKSHSYNGYYFVLGGNLPIMEREPEKKIRLKELKDRILSNNIDEIILSLNINAEGENTTDFLKIYINNLDNKIKISVLGRGLSTGSELEYSDSDTIKNAIKNRGNI